MCSIFFFFFGCFNLGRGRRCVILTKHPDLSFTSLPPLASRLKNILLSSPVLPKEKKVLAKGLLLHECVVEVPIRSFSFHVKGNESCCDEVVICKPIGVMELSLSVGLRL